MQPHQATTAKTQPAERHGVRLVSTFGLGQNAGPDKPKDYHQVIYRWEGRDSQPTRLVQLALIEHFSVTSLAGVASKEVINEWVRYQPKRPEYHHLRGDRLGRQLGLWSTLSVPEEVPARPQRPILYLEQLDGGQESTLYETFNAYRALLAHQALPKLGEQTPPAEIIFDVTHGFRTQPIIGLAAVLFTLQEWERLELEQFSLPRIRVVYGAFEDRSLPQREDVAVKPIWDITPFLSLQQLNHGLSDLMKYGHSALLGRVITELLTEEAALDSAVEWLEPLREATQQVSDDLNLIRSRDLVLRSAPRLLETAVRALEEAERHPRWAMLTDTLVSLRQWAVELTLTPRVTGEGVHPLVSQGGVELMKRLAARYKSLRQYPAMLATISEAKISHHALSRAQPERRFSQPDKTLGLLRNSVMHAQFDREQPSSAQLLSKLTEQAEQFMLLPLANPSQQAAQEASARKTLLISAQAERPELERSLHSPTLDDTTHDPKLNKAIETGAQREQFDHRVLHSRLQKHQTCRAWLISPTFAANPNISALLATAASKLDVELYFLRVAEGGELIKERLHFKPSMWFGEA